MYAVIRTYANSPDLADELQANRKAIKTEIGSVAGFVSYQLINTANGVVTITVCEQSRGCEESSRRAADWLRKHLPDMQIPPPIIQEGEVAFQVSRAPALV